MIVYSLSPQECKCSPITLQPLAGHKAAVLTVLIRLPSGDEEYTLPDQCGMAIGSALITVGTSASKCAIFEKRFLEITLPLLIYAFTSKRWLQFIVCLKNCETKF